MPHLIKPPPYQEFEVISAGLNRRPQNCCCINNTVQNALFDHCTLRFSENAQQVIHLQSMCSPHETPTNIWQFGDKNKKVE